MATFRGTKDKDRIIAGTGSDNVSGFAGNDTLKGGNGNDTLNGGTGNDSMAGDAGNDLMREFRNSGSDRMDGGAGIDTVDYRLNDNGNLPITLNLTTGTVTRFNSLKGVSDVDRLFNIERVIATSSKNDVITAEESTTAWSINLNSASLGNAKSSFATANRFEHATGGNANDTLTGSSGNNTLNGQGGNDRYVFLTGFGTDVIIDGEGFDTVDLSNLSQGYRINLTSGDGNEVESDSNADRINWEGNVIEAVIGSSGNDTITGSVNSESLHGSGGDDTFYQVNNSGNDTIIGGGGTDTLDYSQSTFKVVYDTSGNLVISFDNDGLLSSTDQFAGIERLIGSNNVNSVVDASNQNAGIVLNLETFVADNLISGLTYIKGFNGVEGGAGDDDITGNINANILTGNDGDDTISGGGGNDTITGGDGNDLLNGGPGSDTFIFDDDWGVDVLQQDAGVNDVLDFSLVTEKLIIDMAAGTAQDVPTDGSAINRVTWDNAFIDSVITGANDDQVTGSAGKNAITTGLGDDVVNAGNGNDTISGGSGNDTLNGQAGNDLFVFTDNEEPDVEADQVDGGADTDMLDFAQMSAPVTFDTVNARVTGTRIQHSVANIELIVGSAQAGDVIDASGETNNLQVILGHLGLTYFDDLNVAFVNYKSGRLDEDDELTEGLNNNNLIRIIENFEIVYTGSGNDIIFTNDAKNTVNAGAGDDLITEDYNADTYVFEDGWGNDLIYRSMRYDFPEISIIDVAKKESKVDAGLFNWAYEVKYTVGGGYTDPDSEHNRLDFSQVTEDLTVYLLASIDYDEVSDGTNTLNWIDNRQDFDKVTGIPTLLFTEVETGSGDDIIRGNRAGNIFISGAGDDWVRDANTVMEGDPDSPEYDVDDYIVGNYNGRNIYRRAFIGVDDNGTSDIEGDDLYYEAGGNDTYYDGPGSDVYNETNLVDISGGDPVSGGDDTYVFIRTNANVNNDQAGAFDYIYDPAVDSLDSDVILFSGFSPSDFVITAERNDDFYIEHLQLVCEVYGDPWTITILQYFTGSFIDDDSIRSNPDDEGQSIVGNGSISKIVFDPNGDTLADLSGGTDDDITVTPSEIGNYIAF